jgi:hypothetical protein
VKGGTFPNHFSFRINVWKAVLTIFKSNSIKMGPIWPRAKKHFREARITRYMYYLAGKLLTQDFERMNTFFLFLKHAFEVEVSITLSSKINLDQEVSLIRHWHVLLKYLYKEDKTPKNELNLLIRDSHHKS